MVPNQLSNESLSKWLDIAIHGQNPGGHFATTSVRGRKALGLLFEGTSLIKLTSSYDVSIRYVGLLFY